MHRLKIGKDITTQAKNLLFLYPPNWVVNSKHNDANGYTEATLTNPN
jgi:hypothetical protein